MDTEIEGAPADMSQPNHDDVPNDDPNRRDHDSQVFYRLDSLEGKTEKMQEAITNLTRSVDSLAQSVTTMQRTLDKYDKVEKQLIEVKTQISDMGKIRESIEKLQYNEGINSSFSKNIKRWIGIAVSALFGAAGTAAVVLAFG